MGGYRVVLTALLLLAFSATPSQAAESCVENCKADGAEGASQNATADDRNKEEKETPCQAVAYSVTSPLYVTVDPNGCYHDKVQSLIGTQQSS